MSFIPYDSKKLTPLKENNPSYEPSSEQVISYAQQILELNLPADMEFVYLAEQALKAPLPQDWQACEYFVNSSSQMKQNIIEDESIIVYRNKKTKQVIYDHPLDIVYKEKARQLKLMKNTAKYSQYITPINEELMESSVVVLNKNNSKKLENQSNKSDINMKESSFSDQQSKNNKNFSYKNSQLVKNVTQQSVLQEQSSNQFENLSMITDYEQHAASEKSFNDGKAKSNKNPLKLLKQKPNVIRPIYVPTQKQKRQKRLKEKQRKLEREKEIKNKVKEMIFSALLQVNTKKMKEMKQNLKSSHNMKEIQQKILIMRQFDRESSPQEMKKLYRKQEQLKRLQRQNKVMDQKIKETIKLIELQKSHLSNSHLFHGSK